MRFEGASIRGSSSNRSEMRVKLLSILVIISQKSMMLFLISGRSAVIDQIFRNAPIKLKFSQLVRIQKCITARCQFNGLLQYSGSYRWNLTLLWKLTMGFGICSCICCLVDALALNCISMHLFLSMLGHSYTHKLQIKRAPSPAQDLDSNAQL